MIYPQKFEKMSNEIEKENISQSQFKEYAAIYAGKFPWKLLLAISSLYLVRGSSFTPSQPAYIPSFYLQVRGRNTLEIEADCWQDGLCSRDAR